MSNGETRVQAEALLQSLVGGLRPRDGRTILFTNRGYQFGLSHEIGRPEVQDLGSQSGSVRPDYESGTIVKVTLTGDVFIQDPKHIRNGRTYVLILKQDGTGSRVATWDTVFKWPKGTNNTLSEAPNAVDVVTMVAADGVLYSVLQTRFI